MLHLCSCSPHSHPPEVGVLDFEKFWLPARTKPVWPSLTMSWKSWRSEFWTLNKFCCWLERSLCDSPPPLTASWELNVGLRIHLYMDATQRATQAFSFGHPVSNNIWNISTGWISVLGVSKAVSMLVVQLRWSSMAWCHSCMSSKSSVARVQGTCHWNKSIHPKIRCRSFLLVIRGVRSVQAWSLMQWPPTTIHCLVHWVCVCGRGGIWVIPFRWPHHSDNPVAIRGGDCTPLGETKHTGVERSLQPSSLVRDTLFPQTSDDTMQPCSLWIQSCMSRYQAACEMLPKAVCEALPLPLFQRAMLWPATVAQTMRRPLDCRTNQASSRIHNARTRPSCQSWTLKRADSTRSAGSWKRLSQCLVSIQMTLINGRLHASK